MTESFTPTEFIAVVNQTLEYAYSSVVITGEVSSFNVSKGKWVFFDLKDDESSISCFMAVWNLRVPLEDGMKIAVRGTPKLWKQGKCSLTVNAIKPIGEGSLKKAYELLKKKLTAEGLFDAAKKRPMPEDLVKLGVISSTGAAGYGDFIKIINRRWGGMKVQVANTQVQGMDAPDQIIRALKYFNERGDVQVIAILRGGGSADDLSCFNDEALVREIAASRIPVITGIGHDRDESLADLAADVRALTPSNAAEILTKDRAEEKTKLNRAIERTRQVLLQNIESARQENRNKVGSVSRGLLAKYIEPMSRANREKIEKVLTFIRGEYEKVSTETAHKKKLLETLNPEKVLRQGYAILSGKISPGELIKITTLKQDINAEIKEIHERE
ncbi:exodeoxyribonuclease VII large subunit [Candidatus Saccharibacteria bacterium]|nr:exodeoxyribonuclease VII large subunit [Candidatus Saccharibacteria bacterium]